MWKQGLGLEGKYTLNGQDGLTFCEDFLIDAIVCYCWDTVCHFFFLLWIKIFHIGCSRLVYGPSLLSYTLR